jgi:hypothetical protein
MLPCSRMTFREPVRSWSPSTFWVIRVKRGGAALQIDQGFVPRVRSGGANGLAGSLDISTRRH